LATFFNPLVSHETRKIKTQVGLVDDRLSKMSFHFSLIKKNTSFE